MRQAVDEITINISVYCLFILGCKTSFLADFELHTLFLQKVTLCSLNYKPSSMVRT